jgi:ribonuclease-3
MNTISTLQHHLASIEAQLKYHFKNPSLLFLSFVHRSYVNEHKEVMEHNERLEFLGDSILGMIIAEHLYRKLPTTPEGELSTLRSRLVEASPCVAYLQKLGVEKYVLLGKGERMNDGRGRDTILADLFEAIIGAIYLDGGFEATKTFIFDHFSEEIDAIIKAPLQNWKALLQDYCQKNFQQHPSYKVIDESGPDHSKVFNISVFLDDKELGHGTGSCKKEAQQAAAADAMSRLSSPQN